MGVLNSATFNVPAGYTEANKTLPYIDVTFQPAPGAQLNYDSILGAFSSGSRTAPMSAPFTVTYTPVGGQQITLTVDSEPIPITTQPDAAGTMLVATPVLGATAGTLADDGTLQSDSVSVFRYVITSANFTYSPGTVIVTFTKSAWSDSQGDPGQPGAMTFDVQGPTATISNPSSSGSIDVSALNNRHYIDLTLPIPANLPNGYTIDPKSVTTLTPKFSFSGTGVGTAAVDTSQAPVLLSGNTYRFWITGTFSSNDVTVNFIPGSYSFIPNNYAPASVSTATVSTNGVLTVTFPGPPASPSGLALDPNSIIRKAASLFSSVSLTGETITLIAGRAPTEVGTSSTFLFPVTVSPAITSAMNATVAFNQNAWSFTDPSGTFNSMSLLTASVTPLQTNGVTYVDVTFLPAVGETLNTATITGGQFSLTGATAASASNNPLALGTSTIGTTYRYFVTASFSPGTVTVTFNPGTFSDNPVANASAHQDFGSSQTFTVTGPTVDLVNPGDNGGNRSGGDQRARLHRRSVHGAGRRDPRNGAGDRSHRPAVHPRRDRRDGRPTTA